MGVKVGGSALQTRENKASLFCAATRSDPLHQPHTPRAPPQQRMEIADDLSCPICRDYLADAVRLPVRREEES